MQAQTNWGYNPAGTRYIFGDSTYIYLTPVLGINEVKAESGKVKVYPNPSTGVFTFQSSVISGQWSVEVYNVLGEKVETQCIASLQTFNIDLRSKHNGVYFYMAIANNGNILGEGKLVVEH
jgi:hypothetical protein